MNSATILHKLPGLLVPDTMLKKASVACPTAFGFAGQLGGELKFETLPKGLPLSELQELQNAFKDEHLVMFFANFPKAVLPDDCQPWVLNDSHGNPILTLFCEGNAKEYVGLNGDHTGEYCASDEIMFPRLTKCMETAGDDVEKWKAELNKPGVRKVLESVFDDRGVYVFLPRIGEPISFGSNKLGGAFSWGHASNTHGYTETASTTEKVQEVAKSGLAFLRGGGAPAKASTDTPKTVEDPKPDVKADPAGTPSVPASPAPVDPVKELEAKGYKRMFPPPKMGKGGARNLWLRTFNCIPDKDGKFGQLPPAHESSECAVWVQPELIDLSKRSVTTQKEVQALASSVHKFRQKQPALGVGNTVVKTEAEKNAEVVATLSRDELLSKDGGEKPVTVSRSSVREAYVPSTNTVGTMSNENKEKAMLRLAGYLDKDRPRPTPLELQKKEQVHANFSDSTSTSFEERLFLPKEQIHDLFDGNEIAVSMYQEMKWRYIQDCGKTLAELAGTTKSYPEQEAPPQPEKEVVAPPPPDIPEQPKKTGALAFLRGKAA